MAKIMPKPILRTVISASQIAEVVRFDPHFNAKEYPWAGRFIGRYPIPSWQRDLCWSVNQNIELIESVFLGFDIGTYVINAWNMEDDLMVPNSDIIIDGQQRINALLLYVNDSFKVFGLYYSELPIADKRRFSNHSFPKRTTETFDETLLKSAYNRLNFSGVEHEDHQKIV